MSKKSTTKNPGKHRDAGTGRYVTKKEADKSPGTTVKEKDRKRK